MQKVEYGYKVVRHGGLTATFRKVKRLDSGWIVPSEGSGPLAVFRTLWHAQEFSAWWDVIFRVAFVRHTTYKEQWVETDETANRYSRKLGYYNQRGQYVDVLSEEFMPKGKILCDCWYPLEEVK